MEDRNDGILRPTENDTNADIVSEYTVEERDTIPDIEHKFNLSWKDIVAANKNILDNDEDIKPGLRLKIPKR
ncbi:MAG TPA: LysM domain-containing protein [Chitinophagaceae bacterium]|jgi:nucleoid-associated protein YgaU|nr:LysM domain-containing protein [Chitinophagaceae bacterium]